MDTAPKSTLLGCGRRLPAFALFTIRAPQPDREKARIHANIIGVRQARLSQFRRLEGEESQHLKSFDTFASPHSTAYRHRSRSLLGSFL
jgi:hypothetical protein